ncbi:MAG: RluA family pseudouridine synthase [Rickettsiales bacterium]
MTPEELQNRLLYRDGMMLILDKPAGLPVHAGPKGGENLEQYFDGLRFGWSKPPALSHRLDRDTSGCLVLGRHPKALRKLGKLFSSGKVKKAYWAITHGIPEQDSGTIDLPLTKRSTAQKGWWMEVDEQEGKASITDYKVLGKAEGHAWLELSPRTGRTHQIRVHLAAIGCPIVGEYMYSDIKPEQPLHLHSRSITLPLYKNKDAITATAEPPEHMLASLAACGYQR